MIHFGNHFRTTAPLGKRKKVKSFFTELLSCDCIVENADLDVFRSENNVFFGVYYSDDPNAILTEEQFKKGTWAEIKTDDVEAFTDKVTKWGIAPFDYTDKTHFYFHAPWGQAFRISHVDE